MVYDRPNFKFSIDKTNEFSEDDINAFLTVYREANKPQDICIVKERIKAQ